MFKIKINNNELEFDKPVRALELLTEENKYRYFACKINNRLRELTYIINRDTELEFLDLNEYNAMDIYQNSLRYVLCMAMHNLYPNAKVDINRFSRNDDGTYSRKSLVKIVPIEKGSKGAWSIGLFNENEGNSKRYTGDIYGIAEIKEDGSLGEREIIDKGAIAQYEKMSN